MKRHTVSGFVSVSVDAHLAVFSEEVHLSEHARVVNQPNTGGVEKYHEVLMTQSAVTR